MLSLGDPFLRMLLLAFVAAALSFLLTPLARRLVVFVRAVNQPGTRKVHKQPTARMGGLAVIAQNDKRGCDL